MTLQNRARSLADGEMTATCDHSLQAKLTDKQTTNGRRGEPRLSIDTEGIFVRMFLVGSTYIWGTEICVL